MSWVIPRNNWEGGGSCLKLSPHARRNPKQDGQLPSCFCHCHTVHGVNNVLEMAALHFKFNSVVMLSESRRKDCLASVKGNPSNIAELSVQPTCYTITGNWKQEPTE